ncbi:arylsulfatase [candidate division KSB1 bacterium]
MDREQSRRNFLKTSAYGVTSLSLLSIFSGCTKPKRMPNIIVIMADDLGYGDLGCYGATQIPTPNIDELARKGILFTDAHAPAAVCTPTRYSILTGRYCWRSRLKRGNLNGYSRSLIEPDRKTIASMLKEKDYVSACIGKWHLGFGNEERVDYTQPLRPGPLDVGFDYFFGIPASLDMPPYCFIENDRTVGTLSEEKNPYNTLQRNGLMTPGWKDEEVGPTFTRKAITFIEKNVKSNPDQPFFLYLPYQAPHTPCTPPDFIKGRSQAGVRGDMVTELDWAVGQILGTVEKHNLTDNTLIILTGDNGALTTGPAGWADDPPEKYDLVHNGHRPNGSLRGQKSDTWDGGHREPFIACWPGRIKPGTTCNEIICLTDIMATCAAITGIELPENAGEDSYNILPALLGQKREKPIREAIVHHSGSGVFSIRQGDWKLILGRGSGGFSFPARIRPEPGEAQGQLYNLKTDPAENDNLWTQHPEIVTRLTKLLDKYKEQGYSRPQKVR